MPKLAPQTSSRGSMHVNTVKFWKMHGLGNDYIVIDNRDTTIKDEEISSLAKRACQRRFSVGADGLILLLKSEKADVKMRIFNADGSEAEMCGNGIRCFAKYCYERKIVLKQDFPVETLSGLVSVHLCIEEEEVKNVVVDMGKPIFDRGAIPMRGKGRCIDEPFSLNERECRITCLSVGNPHCVIFVEAVDSFPVKSVGPKIENNPLFTQRVNVEFVQILNREEIQVRVWERGVGETLACGTGACAAVTAANILGKCDREVIVHLLGGDLIVKYSKDLSMSGPAEKSFEGVLYLGEKV